MATFKLQISTIDNEILEFKQGWWFNCDLVVPLGVQVIRMYDKNECILSKKVYLMGYQGRRFGTEEFSTMQEFLDYVNLNCVPETFNILTELSEDILTESSDNLVWYVQ